MRREGKGKNGKGRGRKGKERKEKIWLSEYQSVVA